MFFLTVFNGSEFAGPARECRDGWVVPFNGSPSVERCSACGNSRRRERRAAGEADDAQNY